MPKNKTEEEKIDYKGMFSGFAENVAKGFATTWIENIKSSIKEFFNKLKRKIYGHILAIFGMVLAFIGFSMFLNEVINFSNGLGYVIMGIVALFIGFLLIHSTKNG